MPYGPKYPIGMYFATDEGGICYQDSYGAGLVYEPCGWRPGELDILCRLLNERGELDWDELEPLIDAELNCVRREADGYGHA